MRLTSNCFMGDVGDGLLSLTAVLGYNSGGLERFFSCPMPSELRIAIVSDTHGYLDPRIAALISRCDYAVHAGDVGGIDVLLAMQPRYRVIAVRGNNDTLRHWSTADKDTLEKIGLENRLALPGGELWVVHGDRVSPVGRRHEKLRERYAHARVVVYGHSHRLTCDLQQVPWILNPGAAGRARTFGGPSCILLTICGEEWSVQPMRFPVP